MKNKNVEVIAHAGGIAHSDGKRYAPNTLSAIQAALKDGVDMMEIDVRSTKDGQLVLLHDPFISRTYLGKGKVNQMSLATLLHYNARDLFSSFWNRRRITWWLPPFPLLSKKTKNETIPTLKEVLDLMKKKYQDSTND